MSLPQAAETALLLEVAGVGSVGAVAVVWEPSLGLCLFVSLAEMGRRMGPSFDGMDLSGQCYRRHRRKRKNLGSWYGRPVLPGRKWRVGLVMLL